MFFVFPRVLRFALLTIVLYNFILSWSWTFSSFYIIKIWNYLQRMPVVSINRDVQKTFHKIRFFLLIEILHIQMDFTVGHRTYGKGTMWHYMLFITLPYTIITQWGRKTIECCIKTAQKMRVENLNTKFHFRKEKWKKAVDIFYPI